MATKFVFKYGAAGGALIKQTASAYAGIPDPSIEINDHFIPFTPAGSFQDVSVYSTFYNSWEASSGSASWITVSQMANNGALGNGYGTFRATAASNSSGNRTGQIRVLSKYDGYQVIDISQNILVSDSVSCSPTFLNFTALGKAKITTVTSSGTWTTSVISDPDNIIFSYTASGTTGQNCTIQLSPNDWSEDTLAATLRFTVGTAVANLTICQDGMTFGCV